MAACFPRGKQPEFPVRCIGTRKLSNLIYLSILQILSSLDIIIPMHLLLRIFKLGVEQIQSNTEEAADLQAQPQPANLQSSMPGAESVSPMSPQKLPQVSDPYDLYDRETELVLPCFIMMLDILLKQVGNIQGGGGLFFCVIRYIARVLLKLGLIMTSLYVPKIALW